MPGRSALPGGWAVEPAMDVSRNAMSAMRNPFCAMSRQAFRAGPIASRRTRRFVAEKKRESCVMRGAECLVQRASGESLGESPRLRGRKSGPERWFGVGAAASRAHEGHQGPIGPHLQARRRSSTFEGDSPNRAAYSFENVDSRANPHPVAMAATEASPSADSSR